MDPNYDNMSFIDRWFLESSESTPNLLDLQLMSLTADPKPPQQLAADQGFIGTCEPSPMLPPVPPFIDDVPLHYPPPPPRVGGFIPEPPHYYDPFNYWPPHDEEGLLFPNNDLSSALNQQHHNGFHQPNYGFPSVFPPMASSSDHSLFQMPQQVSSVSNDNAVFIQSQMQESNVERDHNISTGESSNNGHVTNKRTFGTVLPNASPQSKEKRRRAQKDDKSESSRRELVPRKTVEVVINGVTVDISGIPTPFCTCTGTQRHCYKWGTGGWQSSCCTNSLSSYPLPLSDKRRGTRIAGRKMSLGGFKRVMERLASEGYDFSNAIDLRSRWARHGTNKFVTIR